jgi:hypothetical protein
MNRVTICRWNLVKMAGVNGETTLSCTGHVFVSAIVLQLADFYHVQTSDLTVASASAGIIKNADVTGSSFYSYTGPLFLSM